MTALQELIRFLKRDKMQEFYTKEQMIHLLEFKLEKEKEQIINAAWKGYVQEEFFNAEQYYQEQYLKK
jgi:hypothetical protein